MNLVRKVMHNKRLIRYFVMACAIVLIELVTFQILYILKMPYIYATGLSFLLAVVLNWAFSRTFVFGASHFHPFKEFSLVAIGSLVGLAIQSLIITVSVEVLHIMPFVGKVLSILFSFFWNYWFRAKYIFRDTANHSETIPNDAY